MTNREKVMSCLEGLAEADWRECYSDSEVQETARQALDLIDEMLKEHEAEKPIAKEDDTYECCICGAIVGQDELDASGIVQERFNYCQNCGKAVKWE